MKKTKENKGITLIALIITIIVLLILAGITISLVVGDNGVLNQAQNAKTRTDEARFIEDAGMAYDEIYAEKSGTNDFSEVKLSEVVERLRSEYDYEITEIASGVGAEIKLKEKIGVIEGRTKTISVLEGDGIEYYAKVKGIYYKVKLGSSNVELEEVDELPINNMPTGDVSLEINSKPNETVAKAELNDKLLDITGVKKGDTKVTVKLTIGEQEKSGTIKIGVYRDEGNLANVGEIGDYVDINLNYENVKNDTGHKSNLTGWRILSIGEVKDEIKLVSAGCPLTYYRKRGDVKKSIEDLEDLYKTIQLNNTEENSYFVGSGFANVDNVENSIDLTKVFNNIFINVKYGVHSLGCGSGRNGYEVKATKYDKKDEVETLYAAITGQAKLMSDLVEDWIFDDSRMRKVAGERWRDSFENLLANGQSYWLGGCSYDGNTLLGVFELGDVRTTMLNYVHAAGVRPVITLKSGITIDTENTGSGLSSDSALMITLGED